jgi:hypothetical protein
VKHDASIHFNYTQWIENYAALTVDNVKRRHREDETELNFRNTGLNHYAEEHASVKNAWSTPRKYGFNADGKFWYHNTARNLEKLATVRVKVGDVVVKLTGLKDATPEQRVAWLRHAGDVLGAKTIAFNREYVIPNTRFVMTRRVMVRIAGVFVGEPTVVTELNADGFPVFKTRVTVSYKPDDAHKTWVPTRHSLAGEVATVGDKAPHEAMYRWFAVDAVESWYADEDAAGTNTGTLTELRAVKFWDDNSWSAWNHWQRVKPGDVQYDFGWKALREARAPFHEELVMAVFHPDRVGRMLTAHGLDWMERV